MRNYHLCRTPGQIMWLRMRGIKEVHKEIDERNFVFVFQKTLQLEREIDDYETCMAKAPVKQIVEHYKSFLREINSLRDHPTERSSDAERDKKDDNLKTRRCQDLKYPLN